MNINYDKLRKKFWYEDEYGNEVSKNDPRACRYRHCFPIQLVEKVDSYRYHPKNAIIKFLCGHIRGFYEIVSRNKEKTYSPMFAITNTISKEGQDCIVSMVNSGDFSLEEALWVYGKSCERCSNVLIHKYLNEKDGYKEYSEEWKRCGTTCEFCESEVKKHG